MLKTNPCVTCGACCAFFRVSFLWSGAVNDDSVPTDLTDTLNETRRCMKGTNQKDPKCIALEGEIGVETKCGIYRKRPGPCRRFGVQWQEGEAVMSERDFIHCNRARHRWNLSRLSRRRVTIINSEPASEKPEEMP